ncbi:MAG: response regulator [Lachnospiraceae bacterium]|nr:response regulator [Lachnospiraceae bacterium]MCI9100032.1 response regulator [Lachnospiraceae bacterium]MCI9357460.1 response regulator [Lachnospiraceae bacterium]
MILLKYCNVSRYNISKKVILKVKKRHKKGKSGNGPGLILSILLTFCILGTIVYFVARRISSEMSQSAISNLSESLELVRGTIEAILDKEAEFQKLMAQEISVMGNPEKFIQSYSGSQTMVKISYIAEGTTKGVSNTGEEFTAEELDFSSGKSVGGLPVSTSYLNDMGTWAYTIKCPVVRNGRETAVLYIEYIYESFDEALPSSFYNRKATLYIMDAKSRRFVLKPKGLKERTLGHLDLNDFYRANLILEPEIQEEVSQCIRTQRDIMFYHTIQQKDSLIYMWAVNEGAVYLVGYVPIEAIQREGDAVNQNIFIVVFVMLVAFVICCILYFLNNRQQMRYRKEQERERELHNQQLAEALQAAQIASSSKTTFLSNMSHDIRTPMNAILGFTILLAKDADNPGKVREYTKKITASGQHLLSLINDVLDVSKIESGKVVLTIGEFTLNNMVSSVDAIIRPMAREKGQEFEVLVSGVKQEHLIGDETRINQILINLLSNAVKYTQEGGNIWLRIIGLGQHSSQYEHIRIEVEDNGYGMSQDYLEVIFDAFTRAENSTTNKVQGTGLGMAITKNIVELMGGTIQVSSQVDKGSLFIVELDLRIPDGKSDEQFWQENKIHRILVVDDETDMGRNIQMLMEDAGVQAELAFCGEDALCRIRSAQEMGEHYDVILLDWKMPDMDGIETARCIRKIVPDGTLILLLSAHDWDEIEEDAVGAGIQGFLTKPFFVSAFKEKIFEINTAHDQEIQASENAKEHSLNGVHFLVAEDNEINSEILEELLEVEGAVCHIAENGHLAVEAFKNAPPGTFDAILMDVQMPVMNGYEATLAIRSLEREDAETIPIIAMTANAFAEDVRDAKDAGMNDHIAKPIDMDIVRKTLYKYLKEK